MKRILLSFVILLFFALSSKSQTIYVSKQTGDWNVNSTWNVLVATYVGPPLYYVFVPAPATVPPSSSDFVTVSDGHVVTLNSVESCQVTNVVSVGATTPAKLLITSTGALTTDSVVFAPSNDGITELENNGTVTIAVLGSGVRGKTALKPASASSVTTLINNGTYTTGLLEFVENGGTATVSILGGATLDVEEDIDATNTAPANTTIDLSAGNGTLALMGNFTGSDITLNGGTSNSKVEFRGIAAQLMPAPATFSYDEVRVYNGAGVTLQNNLALNGDFGVFGSGVFNQNGFNITTSATLGNAGTFNASGNIILGLDFINSGTFTSLGANINVARDWNNTGIYTYAVGDVVVLDGSVNAIVSGSTNFYELNIQKALGNSVSVASGSVVDITGVLDLNSGGFNVDPLATVTLLSNASGTAQLDVIESGASYSGDLQVQRYLALGNDGWREVTSPVAGTTLADWQNDGIVFTGFPGADYNGTNWYSWNNSYTYTEANANGVKDNGWVATTNITNPTGFTQGHRIYMGAGNGNSMTATLSVKGVPNTGLQSVTVTNGGGGSGDDQNGWNLIGNPYPCTIDWNLVATSGVDAAYWIWNATAGNYGIYQNGNPTGTNGVDAYIAHSQAFWVHASAASGSVIFSEINKVRNDKAFVKSYIDDEFVRITLSGNVNSYSDEAIISFADDATENYDAAIDGYKLYTELEEDAPSLAILTADNIDLSIAGIQEFKSRDIPIKAFSGTMAYGTYTIEFDIPESKLVSACITLEDLETGTITDIKSTPNYTFTTTANSPQERFVLHIVQPFEVDVQAVSCNASSDGSVSIQGAGIAGETFSLLKNGTTVAAAIANNNGEVTFENLEQGIYTVSSSYTGSCGGGDLQVEVREPQDFVAGFELVDNILYLDGGNATIAPVNTSEGDSYFWDFGDGTTSTQENPVHTYTEAGEYVVVLTVQKGTCSKMVTQTVDVRATTGIEDKEGNDLFSVLALEDALIVSFDRELQGSTLELLDIKGQVVVHQNITQQKVTIPTDNIAKGVYLVRVNTGSVNVIERTFVK